MQSITVTFVEESNAADQDSNNITPIHDSTTKARKGSRSSSRHSWVRGSSRSSNSSSSSRGSAAKKSSHCVAYAKDFNNFLSVANKNLRDTFTTPQCVSPSLSVRQGRLQKALQAPKKREESPSFISESAEHQHQHQGVTVRKFMLGAASCNRSASSDCSDDDARSSDDRKSTKNSSELNDQAAAQEAQEQW